MEQNTIPALLSNRFYRGNQSLLAKEMGINRGTLRKYMNDEEGDYHVVIFKPSKDGLGDTVMELFTNQTNRQA